MTYRPSACTDDGGKLTFAFGKSGVTAQVKVSVKQRYFVFELAAVSDPDVDEAVIGGLAVDLAKDMSASVAWASDGEFAAAVVPLNLQVEVGMAGERTRRSRRSACGVTACRGPRSRWPGARHARCEKCSRRSCGPRDCPGRRWAGRSRWTPRRTAARTCSPPCPRATWTSGSSWGVAAASRRSTSAPGGTGWATTSPTPACSRTAWPA